MLLSFIISCCLSTFLLVFQHSLLLSFNIPCRFSFTTPCCLSAFLLFQHNLLVSLNILSCCLQPPIFITITTTILYFFSIVHLTAAGSDPLGNGPSASCLRKVTELAVLNPLFPQQLLLLSMRAYFHYLSDFVECNCRIKTLKDRLFSFFIHFSRLVCSAEPERQRSLQCIRKIEA